MGTLFVPFNLLRLAVNACQHDMMGQGEKKIMMIDDDIEDQDIFLMTIHQVDASIICLQPATASLALDLLLHDKFRPDYIFLDLNMPVMNGFEFLKELKEHEHLAGIPVIIYTTSSELEDWEKAKELGATDFLTKKVSLKELKNSLSRLLQFGTTAGVGRGQ